MSFTWRTAAVAAGVSFVIAGTVNIALLLIATAIAGPINVAMPGRSQTVGFVEVLLVSALAAIIGAVGSAILSRWSWGLRAVAILGVVVTVLSLGAVINAGTLAGMIALGLMHLVTGLTVVTVNVMLHSRRVRVAQPTR